MQPRKILKADWVRVAAVDTMPLHDGEKHGSAIFNPTGALGTFRFLLWQNIKKGTGTFYTELDVYEKGKWTFEPLETMRMRQLIFDLLGKSTAPDATEILSEWFDKFLAKQVPPSVQLDLLEAAEMRKDEALTKKIEDYKKSFVEADKIGPYRVTMYGGDANAVRNIFDFTPRVACAATNWTKRAVTRGRE